MSLTASSLILRPLVSPVATVTPPPPAAPTHLQLSNFLIDNGLEESKVYQPPAAQPESYVLPSPPHVIGQESPQQTDLPVPQRLSELAVNALKLVHNSDEEVQQSGAPVHVAKNFVSLMLFDTWGRNKADDAVNLF